jgi:hypothetical protein
MEKMMRPITKMTSDELEFYRNHYHLPLYGKYITKTEKIDNGPYFAHLKVSIFRREDDGSEDKIGEYIRNYGVMYETFHPFVKDGKEYALYSRDYTATRVMSLPDCKDLGGEERDSMGFCPVDFFVPFYDPESDIYKKYPNQLPSFQGQKGFVAGCHWGDDDSWKVQLLDLSQIEEGIIAREERFGYIGLAGCCNLAEGISISRYDKRETISIATDIYFNLETGELDDDPSFYWGKDWQERSIEDESE